ncbi:MAG: hypothetical protein V7704_23445 [Aurantimonas endophytica]
MTVSAYLDQLEIRELIGLAIDSSDRRAKVALLTATNYGWN